MDVNIKQATEELGKKMNSGVLEVELTNFERKQREFKGELVLKRVQVDQLRKDLDAANLENHILRREVETCKSTIDEKNCSVNLALKKTQDLEAKLQAKLDLNGKLQLQYDLIASENEKLKKLLRQTEMERYELSHKYEDLQAKHECDIAFQNDLRIQETKLKTSVDQLNSEMNKLETNLATVMQIPKMIETSDQIYGKVKFYVNKLKDAEKNNRILEKQLITVKAKYNKLEEMLKNANILRTKNANGKIFLQWKRSTHFYKGELEAKSKIIDALIERLNSENDANSKLIKKDRDNDKLVLDLERKLQVYKQDQRTNQLQAEEHTEATQTKQGTSLNIKNVKSETINND